MDITAVRCQHLIDGEECGTLLQRGCSSCPTCKGEVDPRIWQNEPMHVCGAPLEDGTLCDWEFTPGCKFMFCPECGTKLGTGECLFYSGPKLQLIGPRVPVFIRIIHTCTVCAFLVLYEDHLSGISI